MKKTTNTVEDIRKARKEARAGRLVSQEVLYRRLGLSFLQKEPNLYSTADLQKKY